MSFVDIVLPVGKHIAQIGGVRIIRFVPILAATIFTAGCASPEEQRRDKLMNIIESGQRLPLGAVALTRYARVYRFASSSQVEALYFIPDVDLASPDCARTKKTGGKNGQLILSCPPPDGMRAGERRWLGNDVDLPSINDGGCNYIDVAYDIASKRLEPARCHGQG